MKKLICILTLCLFALYGFAGSHILDTIDSLQNVLKTLPHDTTRLKVLTEIILTEQRSPRYLEYTQQLLEEAKRQKDEHYICNSAYFRILYYYNNSDKIDSISKWVNYLKPIAERIHYWRVYFNSQKLLINSYIYNNQFEYAISEALKMQEKAEIINNIDGRAAAYQCLINAYSETNRKEAEKEVLQKAYALFPHLDDTSAKINILCHLIDYSNGRKQYENLYKYLKELVTLLNVFMEKRPEMSKALSDNYLYAEVYYIYYYLGIKDLAAAKQHIKQAQTYIHSQTFFPYVVTYKEACAEYYRQMKNYKAALALSDTVLQMMKSYEFEQIDYAKQFIHKADILHEMGLYPQALSLYEKANNIQDSTNITISAKQLEEIKDMYHLNQLILEKGKLKSSIQIIILIVVGIVLILCASYMLRINRIREELKISEKKTKEAASRTEETNEIKNRFLSNMSHAIRVPLNSVVGFSQLMTADSEINEEARREYSNIIQHNTDKLMRLVNNVLDLSRLEADMMKYQLTDYDIVQICNDAIGVAQMQDPNLHIHFQNNIKQHIVHTDYNRIMQMFVIALSCPFHPSEEERNIHFTLDRNGEILCFKIINSPLADGQCAGQEASIHHDINRLLLKHFGGTYQVITDAPAGPTLLFTYPA